MSKFFQALLSGMFFTLIIDFLLFLGLKLNYTDFYEINLYYNALFVNHQNVYIFFALSLFIGFLIIYISNSALSLILVGGMFFLSASTLIPTIGHALGERLFMEKNVTIKTQKYTYRGSIYYKDKTQTTFYDDELKKIILFDNKELIQ